VNIGEVIRVLRDFRGDTRRDLAQRTGVTEDHIKKIEVGKRKPSLTTLKAIADALDVSIDILLSGDETLVMDELSRRDFLKAGFTTSLATLISPLREIGHEEELWPQHASPEWWILQGDLEDSKGNYDLALEHYYNALKLLPSDYRWARVLVEKVTQMYINKGEFVRAEEILSAIVNAIEEWGTDTVNHDLISGLIVEKRGWIANFRGRSDVALNLFGEAFGIALRWGDKRLESTSHHFLGRASIEKHSRLFYPELFAFQIPNRKSMELGLNEIRIAKRMDQASEPNVGFGNFWEGLGLLVQGQDPDARNLLWRSVEQLRGTVADAYPLAEIHHIAALNNYYSGGPKIEYEDLSEAITGLLGPLSSQNHPYAYVRALIALLCVRYLYEYYKRSPLERKRCVDLCICCFLLHPEPNHTFFYASRELIFRFVQPMEEKEFRDYLHELPSRITLYSEDFSKLKNFSTPTLSTINIVLKLIEDVGRKLGKVQEGEGDTFGD
jgi:transcriptional regulator with XRE-family HTH domain